MYNVCLYLCLCVCVAVCVKIANLFCIALHTENKHYYPGAIMRRLMCVRQEGEQEEEGGGSTSNSETLAPNGGRHLNR